MMMMCSSCCDCAGMCQFRISVNHNNHDHAEALNESTAAMERSACQFTESHEGHPFKVRRYLMTSYWTSHG